MLWLLLLFLLHGKVLALEWEQESLSLKADSATEKVTAAFHYRNTSSETVTITDIKTDCDCTSAEGRGTSVPPGGQGRISVDFRIGARTGVQTRHVHITSSDAPSAPKDLQIRVDILELVQISPRLLFWKRGLEPKVAAVNLKLAQPEHTQVLKAECLDPGFDTAFHCIDATQGRYRIELKPKSSEQTSQCVVLVHYRHKGLELTTRVYGAVR